MKHKYTIANTGAIKGGRFECEYFPEAKRLDFELQGEVKLLGKINEKGSEDIEPSVMESANCKVGTKINFGSFQVEIVSVADGKATADLSVPSLNGKGSAIFDLSEQYVKLLKLDAKGKKLFVKFHLVASLDA